MDDLKLGFSTVIYENSGLSHQQIVEKAAFLGYQGIELNFKEWPTDFKVDSIKNSLQEYGIEVAAIGTRHMYVTHNLYLTSPKLKVRRKSFEYLTECMKIADELNCNVVQAGWAFQGSILEASYNDAWKIAVNSLKDVSNLCRRYNKIFVVEFACKQNAQLLNTVDETLRMLDEVGEDNVFVMIDIYHVQQENYPLGKCVHKANKKLAYVHLADNERLPPGKGIINFKEFISALKEIHYNGYLIMEYEAKSDIDKSLKDVLNFIKQLL
ncbi:sugar phosphate isomerase/epimerase [Candidatus Bathyarchaeota archaeon]|nr:sugar phosphate isomerase/epimerase [Candidatus Bathyarchaeota archaeon]